MQNHNHSGDLNAKETATLLSDWKSDYAKALSDIQAALVRLEEVKNELVKAREHYEKSWFYIIKENFRAVLFFLAIVIGAFFYLIHSSKNISLNYKDGILEKRDKNNLP